MIRLHKPELNKIETIAQSNSKYISFAQGVPILEGGVDVYVKKYVQQMLFTDKIDYYQNTLGILALRQEIAKTISDLYSTSIGAENIMVTHGGISALASLCLMVLENGDELLLPEPTYPNYQHMSWLCKAQPVFTKAFQMERNNTGEVEWRWRQDILEKSITKRTKLIVLTHPSNPCGLYLSKNELISLKQLCESRGIYLVIDEAYNDFIYDGKFTSSTPFVLQSPFVARIGSFSKNFSMSGWRIGFLVGSRDLISSIENVQSSLLLCPNVIGQYAALYALKHEKEIIPQQVQKLKQGRKIICEFFDQLQDRGIISYAKPKAGFYAFIKTHEEDSFDLTMDILNTVHVAMVPGKDFGPHSKSYIRFCFAREPQVITQGVERLQQYFSQKNLSCYTAGITHYQCTL